MSRQVARLVKSSLFIFVQDYISRLLSYLDYGHLVSMMPSLRTENIFFSNQRDRGNYAPKRQPDHPSSMIIAFLPKSSIMFIVVQGPKCLPSNCC